MNKAAAQADDGDRAPRADARRNADRLLRAARDAFAEAGVDAPVRDIAARAGVGIGTLYRRFPQRSDLIAAVFRHEVDACAEAAASLPAGRDPVEALAGWMAGFVALIAPKRGLAAALHSGDPAFDGLPEYFDRRLQPALRGLLDAAAAAGRLRAPITPNALLRAAASLCVPVPDVAPDHAQRMVALLLDGLCRGPAGAAGTDARDA